MKKLILLTAVCVLGAMSSCKKNEIVPNTKIDTPKEVEQDSVAKISFLGNNTIGKIYSFDVNSSISDTVVVFHDSDLTLSDSTDVGCGNNLNVEIGKRYVFGYKNNLGDYVYFGYNVVFYATNNGSPVVESTSNYYQAGNKNTILAYDFDVSTGIFTPGDGIYTPCPTSDYTLRTGI